MNLIGETVGHIRIDELIGEGGMGDVYAGFDEKLQRRVAIKAIRADRHDAETRARFLREARLLSQLDHPNICRIYGYVEGGTSDYLVLELIRGKDLREALDEGLDPAHKLEIAEQVARTLETAHSAGIIHRDLKPANVMLSAEGEVKVLDFGLARSLEPAPGEWQTGDFAPLDEMTAARQWTEAYAGNRAARAERSRLAGVLGTVSSMSPEQARGEPVTAASDMYSLGLLLQELFTGRPAYERDLSPQLLRIKAAEGDTLPVAGLGPELTTLVNRLKSLAPEARPSAAETVRRLRWIRRKPRRWIRWAAAAAAAAALAFAFLEHTRDLRQQRDEAVAARLEAKQSLARATELLEEALASRESPGGLGSLEAGRGHRELARLYERDGDPRMAQRHYRRALESLLAAGRVDEARPLADKLLAAGETDPELLALCRRHGLAPDRRPTNPAPP